MHLRTLLLAAAGLALSFSDAHAWKPVTHIYLAQEAWADAKDGKVTIHAVDHETGAITGVVGEYEVEETVLKAVREHPANFFAGVIGPDAYPDMVTGQMRIHPPGEGDPGDADLNAGGAGSRPWFEKLWRLAFTTESRLEVVAFVTGYLIHAAGDYYAHTWINGYTGGIFDLKSDNGAKHMLLESYVGNRTPALHPIGGVDAYKAVALDGLDGGIPTFVATHLRDIGMPNESNRFFSLPWYFHELRRTLEEVDDWYRRTEAQLRAPLGDVGREVAMLHRTMAWSCDLTKNAPCPVDGVAADRCPAPYRDLRANVLACAGAAGAFELAFGPVAPAMALWRAHVDLHGPLVMLARQHMRAIDSGLERWVETNHRIAMAILFNPDGVDLAAATGELSRFMPTLVSMATGLDPRIAKLIDEIRTRKPPRSIDVLDKIASGARDAGFRALFGADPEELAHQLAGPHAVLDTMFGAGTRARVNADMGLDARAMTDLERGKAHAQRFAHERFGPALNTVTLTKLALMAPQEVERLYRDLGRRTGVAAPRFERFLAGGVPNNVMLTFAHTMDGSHQWTDLALATADRDCRPYKHIFVKLRPAPSKRPGHKAEPPDTCAPVPPLELRAGAATVAAGGSVTLTSPEKITLSVPAGDGQVPPRCAMRGDACTATFTAPAASSDRTVTISALPDPPDRDGRRRATVTLQVLAPLTLEPRGIATAAGLDVLAEGGTLRAGARMVLDLRPALRVRWTVTGPGQLGDPVRARELEALQRTRAAALASAEAAAYRQQQVVLGCGGAPACLGPAMRELEVRTQAVVGAARALDDVKVQLEELARTYVAPATLAAPAMVTVRADAPDGRSAQLGFRVEPAWPALRLAQPVTTVAAGGSVVLAVEPAVPMQWTITRGPGTIAASGAERAAVDAEVARLRKAVPAPARVKRPTLAPGAVDPARMSQLLAVTKTHGAALAKIAAARSTYVAPAHAIGKVPVTLKGVARDGTERTLTVELLVTPDVTAPRAPSAPRSGVDARDAPRSPAAPRPGYR